jgi:hypothetical protein
MLVDLSNDGAVMQSSILGLGRGSGLLGLLWLLFDRSFGFGRLGVVGNQCGQSQGSEWLRVCGWF